MKDSSFEQQNETEGEATFVSEQAFIAFTFEQVWEEFGVDASALENEDQYRLLLAAIAAEPNGDEAIREAVLNELRSIAIDGGWVDQLFF